MLIKFLTCIASHDNIKLLDNRKQYVMNEKGAG